MEISFSTLDVMDVESSKSWLLCFLSVTEGIIAFAWEPNGSRFAVLHGESPRINASFYHVKSNGKIDLISECIRVNVCDNTGFLKCI